LAEIKRLDAGEWFNSDFAGERVPTLEEVLALAVEIERRPTTIALNLKTTTNAAVESVIRALRKYNLFERTFVFDISLETVQRFKEREPRVRCAVSAHTAEELKESLELDFIDVIWTNPQSKDVIDKVQASGKRIYCTIVNDANTWLRAKADGVDGICTNHPLEMKRLAWPVAPQRAWDHYLRPQERAAYRFRGRVIDGEMP
jgi:glycerophosphoryl diester phosphodiesterase